MTRKWVKFRVYYDDGSVEVWTPERLENDKRVAKEIMEMILRSAVEHKKTMREDAKP